MFRLIAFVACLLTAVPASAAAEPPFPDVPRYGLEELRPADFAPCFEDPNGIQVLANLPENCPDPKDFDKALKRAAKYEEFKDLGELAGLMVFYHPGIFLMSDGSEAWGVSSPAGYTLISLDAPKHTQENVPVHELRHQIANIRKYMSDSCIDGVASVCRGAQRPESR